ncbi:hypothetical protein [Erythrobacter sp. F6033]|uniref:hypothetical protein n=1 Tax=Erythrobacter sp. F6033 TaxID=2926401 RepID=UPI001FF330B5|nr:hypothetical protein [Erythrobacter sp. F6033]MCK0129023.1 hypothetical protein [Erythrobacter sp. F6033]
MIRPRNNTLAFLIAAFALGACNENPSGGIEAGNACGVEEPLPALGLMTSLPIYWPADFFAVDVKEPKLPWQRLALEKCNTLVPLDTLSVNESGYDPLAELDRLAVIQPRGLSPSDNVALDEWVRAGGQLLLVLDPMLTGEYDLPLGDPGRPVDAALIPPVVERWGMQVVFDEDQPFSKSVDVPFGSGRYRVSLAGQIEIGNGSKQCDISGEGVFARCAIGEGSIFLLADAAAFEHELIIERDYTGERQPIHQLLQYVFR